MDRIKKITLVGDSGEVRTAQREADESTSYLLELVVMETIYDNSDNLEAMKEFYESLDYLLTRVLYNLNHLDKSEARAALEDMRKTLRYMEGEMLDEETEEEEC